MDLVRPALVSHDFKVASLGIAIYERLVTQDHKTSIALYLKKQNLVPLFIDNPYERLKPALLTFLAHYSDTVIERLQEGPEYDFLRALSELLPYIAKHNSNVQLFESGFISNVIQQTIAYIEKSLAKPKIEKELQSLNLLKHIWMGFYTRLSQSQ